jgi:PAS domain S-box-containing protein
MNARKIAALEAPEPHFASNKASTPFLNYYPELLRALPVGVALLLLEDPADARTFRIVETNPAAAVITGWKAERILNKRLADFPRLLKTNLPRQFQEALQSGVAKNLGEIFYGDECIRQGNYSVKAFPLSQNLLGIAFENVTKYIEREQSLRESEERIRSLIQSVKEYAIIQMDPRGQVVSWNAGAERLKGYTAEEIIGRHFSVFYPKEEVMGGKPERVLAEAAERGQYEEEGWRIRKDGSQFWASIVVTALRGTDGKLQGFLKLTRDMSERRARLEALTKAKEELEIRIEQRAAVLTRVNLELRMEIAERKKAEDQLRASLEQLRALAARLQNVREEERKHVAREIHDELGQGCTAIKMDLALIGHWTAKGQKKVREKVNSGIQLVDNLILMLRRIASELRPRALDDLGLTAALEWQAQEFEKRSGIHCSVTLPKEEIPLDPERSTAIFRIFQESLTNVARHAEADSVEARLQKEGDELIFQVKDNGKGFDPEEAAKRKSLGLIGMKERALLLDGDLRVDGVPGTGTTMTLRIPLPRTEP